MVGQTLNDCFLYFDYNKIKFISANEFNGTICDVFSTFIAYDGIKGSFFRNPEKLIDTIAELIEKAEHGLGFHIHECSIILPQCFFRTRHNVETLDFPEKKIVNRFDVDNVLEKSLVDVEDCVVSECIAIVYKTAEDYIDNPLGQEADKLEAITSTVGVLYRIKEFFDDVAIKLGIKIKLYSAALLAADKLQRDLDTNNSPRIILYVYSEAIDVCYCEMNAIIAQKTIDWGANHYVSALVDLLKIEPREARELLRHVNLNISDSENYYINNMQKRTINAAYVNKALKDITFEIACDIKKAIKLLIGDNVLPTYAVGSPIIEIRGIKRIIDKVLESDIIVLEPELLNWNGTADYAIVAYLEKK